MSKHGTSDRSAVDILEFLAKLVAIFSIFAIVGSVLGTGVPDTRALLALCVSLVVVVGIGIVRDYR
ncbi:hypothetical protein OB955_03585 [Halobacteria archaeon AArc-m2/3/4]|uniref:Uncharacterized protein n=1 Tax=Natronoglomus mannanivorans TaxID=2979990 RepID=A0AAP2YV60_9EURY|nr:hypothetical protein [Halobacteria archaeon AArc-xg1-1]MCU4971819.1 hypothetical protein [Halobacteria archaeon AArc-m2/3/4]